MARSATVRNVGERTTPTVRPPFGGRGGGSSGSWPDEPHGARLRPILHRLLGQTAIPLAALRAVGPTPVVAAVHTEGQSVAVTVDALLAQYETAAKRLNG